MGQIIKYLFSLIILLNFFSVTAGNSDDPCKYSTEGNDFWFGFMQNRSKLTVHYLEVTVTSREGADFTITYGTSETIIGNYTVGANSSTIIQIDYNILESIGEGLENKGIHLVSTKPVNVYALNYRTQSSDVALIYPTESLGKDYFAMCYTPSPTTNNESNSQFLIVASDNNTTVKITPSVYTHSGRQAKTEFSVVLNKGQSYQVQSKNSNIPGQGDLTGSHISSNKPVAVFAGSMAAPVPATGSSYDHLYEQMPPTGTWGRTFFTVPLLSKLKDTYRIMAAEDETTFTIEATNTTRTLNKGQFFEFDLSNNQASRIESTKKILVAQYCRSQNSDGSSGVGDPFMIILSPVVQIINDVTFVAYESNLVRNIFYINIIAPSSEISNITLDDVPINTFFKFYAGGTYAYAQVPISKGTHRIKSSNSKSGFLANIYGFGNSGSTESYGYGVGFNLDIQLDLGMRYAGSDTLVICYGKDIKLEAGPYFEKYQWNTGDTTMYIHAKTEGLYKITATSSRGCKLTDSIYIKLNYPAMDLGYDTSSCGPGKITLHATGGFNEYRWNDGSTSKNFTVHKTGDYIVTGKNIYGCEASDTIHVDVFQVPEVKITGDTLLCGIFEAELKAIITDAEPTLWNYPGAAKWTSSPAGIDFFNAGVEGVTLKATKPGKYTINYQLTTKEGCVTNTSFKIGFFVIPDSSFEVYSPESTSKCSSYERIIEYTGHNDANAKFEWDFGGLILLSTIAPNHFKVTAGANNRSRTIKLVVKENGCTSVQTVKTIGVDPKFNYWVDKVNGCDSMCVQFSSEVQIADSVSYQWTFGDGAVSNIQNPIHCYNDTGKYDVSLIVTNIIDGCRNGSIESQMIKIYPTPVASISADPNMCYNDTVNFEYLKPKAYSKGKWLTNGNKILNTQNINATYILEEEISEVGFLVEENGCWSNTIKIEVKRKPHFDFEAFEKDICLPIPVQLKAKPFDKDLSFKWTIDTISNIQASEIKHNFGRAGFYKISLEAFSNITGCSETLVKDKYIQVYPLPTPLFSQNYKVATLEHPEISFNNESKGAINYYWDFGDGNTSREKHVLNNYSAIGNYKVMLEAETEFGCTDTISSTVKIIPFTFFVPNAFRPESDISENRIFRPIREGIDPSKYSFEIFNRLGAMVFETTNPGYGWNGKRTNGSNADSGIYVWVVKYSDVQGYDHLQKGTVMLMR